MLVGADGRGRGVEKRADVRAEAELQHKESEHAVLCHEVPSCLSLSSTSSQSASIHLLLHTDMASLPFVGAL